MKIFNKAKFDYATILNEANKIYRISEKESVLDIYVENIIHQNSINNLKETNNWQVVERKYEHCNQILSRIATVSGIYSLFRLINEQKILFTGEPECLMFMISLPMLFTIITYSIEKYKNYDQRNKLMKEVQSNIHRYECYINPNFDSKKILENLIIGLAFKSRNSDIYIKDNIRYINKNITDKDQHVININDDLDQNLEHVIDINNNEEIKHFIGSNSSSLIASNSNNNEHSHFITKLRKRILTYKPFVRV